MRAEGRMAVRLLRSLDDIAAHRGNQLGRVGSALHAALAAQSGEVPTSVRARQAPSGAWLEAVKMQRDGTPTLSRHLLQCNRCL